MPAAAADDFRRESRRTPRKRRRTQIRDSRFTTPPCTRPNRPSTKISRKDLTPGRFERINHFMSCVTPNFAVRSPLTGALKVPQDISRTAIPFMAGSIQRFVGSTVAVLCVAAKSVYRSLPNVECYDLRRDVRSFVGGMPVVAHPPCRSWSAYCAHQAKPLPGEKELGPLCVNWLRECGGVLEHPAHSRLFDACKLPKPGWTVGWHKDEMPIWSTEVLQGWWGDTRSKTTWLCFFGITPPDVRIPFRFVDADGDRRRWQLMSKTQRSATHPALAEWLVQTARLAKGSNTQSHRLSGEK